MPVATLQASSQRPRYSYRAQRWSLQSSLDPAFDSGSLRLAPSSKPSKLGSSGSIVACTRRTLSPVALSLRASAHPSRNDLPNPACRVSGLCEYYGCAMVNLSRMACATRLVHDRRFCSVFGGCAEVQALWRSRRARVDLGRDWFAPLPFPTTRDRPTPAVLQV